MAVGAFEDRAGGVFLAPQVREEIERSLRMDGRIEVRGGDEAADALLRGTVSVYEKTPSRFDSSNVVQEYRLRIAVEVSFTGSATGSALWPAAAGSPATKGGPLRRFERADSFVAVPASGMPAETEESARLRLIRDLARDIVRRAVEGR